MAKTNNKQQPRGAKQKPAGKGRYDNSKPTTTKRGDSRKLTHGEILLSCPIFKDSICYQEVEVYKCGAFPFQDEETIVTPKNAMYCPTGVFMEDFSKSTDDNKEWFMHEMTHVWQYYRGYRGRLITKGAFYAAVSASSKTGYKWVYEYYYPKNNGKKFSEFNMEQQADIICHYYGAKFLKNIKYIPRLPFLQSVLADFLKEPRTVALLPGGGPQPYEIPIAP